MLTMSQVKLGRGSRETREAVARFVLRPDGLARSFARTTAEAVRERFQARQQRRRAVVPRMHRSWTFAFLRAVSNGVLRDLNMALVSRQMLRGARSIYVDFVDYDEVAHHAGGNRLESLKVLESLDQVLNVLEKMAGDAPRRYHFVVVSDHGQSLGAPFEDLLREVARGRVRRAHPQDVVSLEENVESWGRVGSVVDDLAGDSDRWTDRCASILAPAGPRKPDQDPAGRRPRRPRFGKPRPGLRPRAGASACANRSTNAGQGCFPAWPPPRDRVHRRAEPHARTRRDRC